MTPQIGDVVLVRRGTGVFDKLVQWGTCSPYFHAAIVVSETDLIEARMSGVKRNSIAEYAGRSDVLSVAQADPAQRKQAVAWAESKLLLGYGWRDILADVLRIGLHIPTGYRFWHWKHFDCSCLVTAAWRAAGIELTLAPAPSPADLGWSPILDGPRPWDSSTGGTNGQPRSVGCGSCGCNGCAE